MFLMPVALTDTDVWVCIVAAAIRYELIFSLAHSTLAILFRSINNITHLSSARVQAISLHSIFTISTLSNAECVCASLFISTSTV